MSVAWIIALSSLLAAPPVGTKPRPVRPCTLKVVEGASAGPIVLGMKRTELERLKLPFKFAIDPLAPEWLVGGPYRLRFDAAGATGRIIAHGNEKEVLCLEPGPSKASCPLSLGMIGGDSVDCPARGVLARRNFLGIIESIEVFPPVSPGPTPGPDACAIVVKPGRSVGPLALGMSRKATAALGLGLQTSAGSGHELIAGPYLVTFDVGADTVASIRLSLRRPEERVCLESGPLTPDLKREELCAHGFCGCVIERDSMATGIAHARCAEGVRFDFADPGRLFMLEVSAATK